MSNMRLLAMVSWFISVHAIVVGAALPQSTVVQPISMPPNMNPPSSLSPQPLTPVPSPAYMPKGPIVAPAFTTPVASQPMPVLAQPAGATNPMAPIVSMSPASQQPGALSVSKPVPISVPTVPTHSSSQPQAVGAPSNTVVPVAQPLQSPVPVLQKQTPINQPSQLVQAPIPVQPIPVQPKESDKKSPTTVGALATSAPNPPTQSNKAQVIEEDDDVDREVGLSTVDLEEPQGNWLLKRLWWERSEYKYGKIRLLVDEVWSLRSDFFTKRTDLDKTVLDPFYLFVGMGQGEFREIIADIIKRLQKSQISEGDFDEQERALLADLQEQKKEIDAIQKSVDAVLTLDHDIDIALSKLMEQVNKVREYERQAWQSLRDIAKELSDKKSQDIFYNIETVWQNIKGIHRYLKTDFSTHFADLSKKITNEVTTIKNSVQQLKNKGIDFKDRADKLEEADKKAHDRALEEKIKTVAAQKAKDKEIQKNNPQEEPQEEPKEGGIFETIKEFVWDVWNNIALLVGW